MSNNNHTADVLYNIVRSIKRKQNQINQLAYHIALILSGKPSRILVKNKQHKRELIKLLEKNIITISNINNNDYGFLDKFYIEESE